MRVSRKIRNLLRRERRASPTVAVLLARSPEDRQVLGRAVELQREFQSKGATWAACVQAVKTGWIAQFRNKYR
jgi:hypothetical protein